MSYLHKMKHPDSPNGSHESLIVKTGISPSNGSGGGKDIEIDELSTGRSLNSKLIDIDEQSVSTKSHSNQSNNSNSSDHEPYKVMVSDSPKLMQERDRVNGPLLAVMGSKTTFKEYLWLLIHDWMQLFNPKANMSCVLLLLAAGCNHGATGGWSSILPAMMSPVGLSQENIGYIGASMMIAQVVGALISGPIVDRYFSGRLKRVIMILQCADIIWFLFACLLLPNKMWNNEVVIVLSNPTATFVVLWILAVLIGLTYGMILPLFSEILAEVAFPVPEASSSNAVFLIGLPMMMLMIHIGSINTSINSPLALGLVIIAFVLMHFVVERYGRPKAQ